MSKKVETRLAVVEALVAAVGANAISRIDAIDLEITHLHDCMEKTKKKMDDVAKDMTENTVLTRESIALTRDIHSIARTFKLIAKAGGYVSGCVAGVVAVYQISSWAFNLL